MNKKLKRLQTVESLFASRESSAGRELAHFEQLLLEARTQLDTLTRYRDGYLTEAQPSSEQQISILQNKARFLRRLDDAIEQQRQVVDRAQLDCDGLRQRFVLCRQRTMAVGKAHSKRLTAHRTAVERKEQKELDAWRAPAQKTPDC